MTDMEKREKVVKGLECCKTIHPDCDHCPYFNTDTERLGRAMCKAAGRPDDDLDMFCLALLHCDALALLKEQEPRVTPRNAIAAGIGAPVWFESHNGRVYTGWALAYDIQKGMGITGECLGVTQPNGHVMWAKLDDYGRTWRMWDKCPNEEQREETAW